MVCCAKDVRNRDEEKELRGKKSFCGRTSSMIIHPIARSNRLMAFITLHYSPQWDWALASRIIWHFRIEGRDSPPVLGSLFRFHLFRRHGILPCARALVCLRFHSRSLLHLGRLPSICLSTWLAPVLRPATTFIRSFGDWR